MNRRSKAKEVMAEIKAKMNLVNKDSVEKPMRNMSKGFNSTVDRPKSTNTNQTRYLSKLQNGQLDKFSTMDIMYFFRDTANNNGCKYVIANPQKDIHQYKLLIERGYSVEDVLAMIEFLFTSEQDYLEKTHVSPNVLVSSWCNTIYSDTQLWVNDEYMPKSKKKHSKREWTEQVTNNEVAKVDDWGGI